MDKANKVILNGKILIDLTTDSVAPETLVKGVTAHDKSGEIIAGALEVYDTESDVNTIQKITPNAYADGDYTRYGPTGIYVFNDAVASFGAWFGKQRKYVTKAEMYIPFVSNGKNFNGMAYSCTQIDTVEVASRETLVYFGEDEEVVVLSKDNDPNTSQIEWDPWSFTGESTGETSRNYYADPRYRVVDFGEIANEVVTYVASWGVVITMDDVSFTQWVTDNAKHTTAAVCYGDEVIAIEPGCLTTIPTEDRVLKHNLLIYIAPLVEDPVMQEKTVTENGEVTPDAEYDGLSKVTVNVAGEVIEEYDGTIIVS